MKWGTKYGADYVNKLYRGIMGNTTLKGVQFYCFTEDDAGLDEGVQVKPLNTEWSYWWVKATIFNAESDHGIRGRVFYIDLDMVITGCLDELLAYRGVFATMSTNDIFCETAADGYNSSIMAFDSSFGAAIYATLKRYFKYVLKFIIRFDHFLEMMVEQAEIV